MNIIDYNLQEFIDKLSSNDHTPGGGSVAALSGALSAALVSMVANLSKGKKSAEKYNGKIDEILKVSEVQREELMHLIFHDIEAFNDVMDAYTLPKNNDDEKAVRHEAIQRALVKATCAPLRTMEHAHQVMELTHVIAEIGNKHAISDAGVAASLAKSTADSAYLNVLINIESLEDRAFVDDVKKRSEKALADLDDLHNKTMTIVKRRITE
ncbi:MAG: cyclodeaminase/cyclohydrolase family protein [Candidatus Zixiibacteriota bacterium]